MTCLRLVLGDQLSHNLASLKDMDHKTDVVLICEVTEEATYVRHHQKKIAFLFSAMRHFADELKAKGIPTDYIALDDPDNSGSFKGEVARAIKRHGATSISVTFPGEYRVWQDMLTWDAEFGVPVRIYEDDRFLCSRESFADWAEGRKQLRMEFFYREMRRRHDILMNGDEPEGGQWNYDKSNRKPAKQGLKIPAPTQLPHDAITKDVLALVAARFSDHFGDLEPFHFAVTRADALQVLNDFIQIRLPNFGDYQDAMLEGEPWMYHSHLSFYINCGLLDPMECILAAEVAYRDGSAPLNAVEGFIRQILGWREYVRGIYWLKMPEYGELNALQASRDLPDFYWSADTAMNCIRQCVTETRQNAYAHHIQRLMVLGNFALIAGLDPVQVNAWYLIVYADAYEWVELPNVSGMILFADGGYLGSKPYAAGSGYINKMSNYCKNCLYKVGDKVGETACPFNYLYWDFIMRHQARFRKIPRMAMMLKTLDRMSSDHKQAIRDSAVTFLNSLKPAQWV